MNFNCLYTPPTSMIGTSAGVGDNIRHILDELGEVYIHGITVQPGKPTILGVVDGKIVIS